MKTQDNTTNTSTWDCKFNVAPIGIARGNKELDIVVVSDAHAADVKTFFWADC